MKNVSRLSVTGIVLVFGILAGCASVNSLAPVAYEKNRADKYPDISLVVGDGTVHTEFGCYGTNCHRYVDRTEEYVVKAFLESDNFSSVSVSDPDRMWLVQVKVWIPDFDKDHSETAKLAVYALSLGAVPTISEHTYRAEIRLFKGKTHIETYTFDQVVKDINSVLVDAQADRSDAVKLLMAQFFRRLETDAVFTR